MNSFKIVYDRRKENSLFSVIIPCYNSERTILYVLNLEVSDFPRL